MTYLRGVMLVMLAGLCWSGIGLMIRLIDEATTWQILLYRSIGLVVVLFGFLAWKTGGRPGRAIVAAGGAGAAGAVCLVMAFAGGIYAIKATTIANAAFLFAAAPFLTALLAWPLLREPVRRGTWWALVLAMVGVALMVREGLALGALAGNVAALISALGFAGFTICLRWGRLSEMLPAVLLGGALSIVVAALVVRLDGTGMAIPGRDVAIAMATGVVLLGGGMVAYTLGSRVVPATDLALLSMVEVVLAPVWGWIFLREGAGTNTLIGGAVLMLALVLNALSGMRHRPPPVL